MKKQTSYDKKAEIFFEYISLINKEQFNFLENEYFSMNRSQKEEFIDEIETNGIYIHQPPFFGNTTEEQFKELYRKHPEWLEEYEFENIETKMTMGDLYFIRLIFSLHPFNCGKLLRALTTNLSC